MGVLRPTRHSACYDGEDADAPWFALEVFYGSEQHLLRPPSVFITLMFGTIPKPGISVKSLFSGILNFSAWGIRELSGSPDVIRENIRVEELSLGDEHEGTTAATSDLDKTDSRLASLTCNLDVVSYAPHPVVTGFCGD